MGKRSENEVFMELMVVIRKEIASYTFLRQGPGAERGAGDSETLWTRSTYKYCSGSGSWTTIECPFLLYRHGVLWFEFTRLYSSKNLSRAIRINTVLCQRSGFNFKSANLGCHESNRHRSRVYPPKGPCTQRYQAWKWCVPLLYNWFMEFYTRARMPCGN